MIAAAAVLLGLGLAASVLLAIASRAFYVYEDPKVLAITDLLPGANCGGCGNAGCAAAAEAIAAGRAPANICVVGGLETAQAIGEVLGQKVEAREPEFHWTSCIYGVGEAEAKFTYSGATDCRAAMLLYGGSKLCPIGCIGLGSCVKACQFGALRMGEHNLPVVNPRLCVGCGACVTACPKGIVTLTSATRRILGEYVIEECTAPCQRSCPTGIQIRDYIREIRDGRYEEALRIIKERCPLPLVCGHICPAPCELECRRNLADDGVAINSLKRFVAEYERKTGRFIHPYKAPDKGIRIALVGGGAEGLTAAYMLARLGYRPTIYEAKPRLGGILRYVITEDRLPREVLDHDIEGILSMGVEARTNQLMGRDFTIPSLLKEGYDAVVLTAGGLDSRKVLHPTLPAFPQPISGLFLLLDLLGARARGETPSLQGHVILVHQGAGVMEAARLCRELGAERVTIIARGPVETPRSRDDTIRILSGHMVVALGGREDRMEKVAVASLAPAKPGQPQIQVLEAQGLVAAEARYPELVFAPISQEETPAEGGVVWQTLETFRTFPQGEAWGIFTPPEPGRVSDSAAVVRSLLSGRRLARAINQHFSEGVIHPIGHLASEARDILNVREIHSVTAQPRRHPPRVDVEGDAKGAWIAPDPYPGLDEAGAREEAARCLQCGLICYRKDAA